MTGTKNRAQTLRGLGANNDPLKIHDALCHLAAKPSFAYRRIYDARLALTIRQFGVTEFATANTKDFEALGFKRAWNPLET